MLGITVFKAYLLLPKPLGFPYETYKFLLFFPWSHLVSPPFSFIKHLPFSFEYPSVSVYFVKIQSFLLNVHI